MWSKKKMKLSTTFKQISLAILIGSVATGCGLKGTGGGGSGGASDAIKAAELSIKKAKKNKWVWRDTGKMLKKAKEANKKGDSGKAIKLANAAQAQAELAVKQYYFEKSQDRSKYLAR